MAAGAALIPRSKQDAWMMWTEAATKHILTTSEYQSKYYICNIFAAVTVFHLTEEKLLHFYPAEYGS